jgi:DNA repair exonuclease SbcCD nuclease subunit
MKKADAILTGDWHLREDTPVCRTDDYWQVQEAKIEFIRDLQIKHGCPIINSGDLFNTWKPSPRLLAWAIDILNRFIPNTNGVQAHYVVPGNHDLAQHNLELLYKTGMAVLHKAGSIMAMDTVLDDVVQGWKVNDHLAFFFPWGVNPINPEFPAEDPIAVAHVMTYQGKKPWPGIEAEDSKTLLKRLSSYKLVVTGHNHKPFVEEHKGRLLVNPGSIMRMSADQIDHKLRVYLWYADTNTVEPVYLPIKQGVITREHIDSKEDRDERMDAFIKQLKDSDMEISLSFTNNMEAYLSKHKVRKGVKDKIAIAMEADDAR